MIVVISSSMFLNLEFFGYRFGTSYMTIIDPTTVHVTGAECSLLFSY
jgi:hypothetical protein